MLTSDLALTSPKFLCLPPALWTHNFRHQWLDYPIWSSNDSYLSFLPDVLPTPTPTLPTPGSYSTWSTHVSDLHEVTMFIWLCNSHCHWNSVLDVRKHVVHLVILSTSHGWRGGIRITDTGGEKEVAHQICYWLMSYSLISNWTKNFIILGRLTINWSIVTSVVSLPDNG